MATYIGSMVIVGAGVALILVALHRLNSAMTRHNLAGLARTQEYQSPIAYSGRVGATAGLQGVSSRPWAADYMLRHYTDRGRDGPLLDGQWREYASSVPRIERGKTTVRQYRRNRLGPGTGAGGVAAVEITHTTPHREPNPGADLLVPLGQAVVSAVVATLLIGVLAVVAGRTDTLRLVGVAFVGVLALAWLWRLGVVDSLLSVVERITQDVDDEDPAEDPGHLMTMQADQARQTVAQTTRQTAADDRLLWLISFVARCYTVGTSESAQGIKPGERAKYLEARDLLFRLGLATWRSETNKRLGWDMTTSQAMTVKTLREHVTAV